MNAEKLTISPKTLALIECLDALNKHWTQTLNALCLAHSDNSAWEMMDERYTPAFEELKAVLYGLLNSSIEQSMGCIGYEDI